ncbi:MAG: hypothetical protein FJY65_10720 [Calditrichaeota bacterium]|nr:hypothetical protein [Calditrichota bacterium]
MQGVIASEAKQSQYQNDTDLKKQILAVTAGVTQTEVVGEWWVVKGTAMAVGRCGRLVQDCLAVVARVVGKFIKIL